MLPRQDDRRPYLRIELVEREGGVRPRLVEVDATIEVQHL